MTSTYQRNRQKVQQAYEDNWIIQSLIWLLFIGLMTGLITVALINLKPYTLLMVGVDVNWVQELPWIGGLFQSLGKGAAYIGAILIWAPVQILECLWLIIALDAQAQKNAIALSQQLTDESGTPKNARVRKASKQLSNIPFFFIRWASLLALAAYTFDLAIGLRAYPLWKDWTTFTLWAKTLNPVWINSQNAMDLGIMLFSFELILILVIVVAQWLLTRRGEPTY